MYLTLTYSRCEIPNPGYIVMPKIIMLSLAECKAQ